jgi:ABC-type antimicrobial peptide transport system permease subunit
VALQVVLLFLTVLLSVVITPDGDALGEGGQLIVGVAGTIGSAITIYVSYSIVTGRAREIALFRALGARRSFVLRLVAREMGLLALVGVFVAGAFSIIVQTVGTLRIPPCWFVYMTAIGLTGPLLGAVSGVITVTRGTISSSLTHDSVS